jgi:hypothetical protein
LNAADDEVDNLDDIIDYNSDNNGYSVDSMYHYTIDIIKEY